MGKTKLGKLISKGAKFVKENKGTILTVGASLAGLAVGGAVGSKLAQKAVGVAGKLGKLKDSKLGNTLKKVKETGEGLKTKAKKEKVATDSNGEEKKGFLGIGDGKPGVFGIGTGRNRDEAEGSGNSGMMVAAGLGLLAVLALK